MGKDLKGKELGVGITQQKNGLYSARFVDKFGKRRQKRFKKLQECRQWIADATYVDEHSNILQATALSAANIFPAVDKSNTMERINLIIFQNLPKSLMPELTDLHKSLYNALKHNLQIYHKFGLPFQQTQG